MKVTECKPGMHLCTMYSYHPEEVLEIEVLPPQEPIYQDFVWCHIINCPPGWKSPRNIRASRLYPTKKDALKHAIAELDATLCEYEADLERLERKYQEKSKLQTELLKAYDEEATDDHKRSTTA